MTRDQKFLIAAGAALIALLIAIGAFSVGVHVGIHGWGFDLPRVAGPGDPAPRVDEPQRDAIDPLVALPGAPAPAAPRVPADPLGHPLPQLMGRVRTISGDTLTVATPQGPRPVHVAPDAGIVRVAEGTGEVPATLDSVEPGERVAVFGWIDPNAPRQLIAFRLLLLP